MITALILTAAACAQQSIVVYGTALTANETKVHTIDYPYLQSFIIDYTDCGKVLDSMKVITQDSSVTFTLTSGTDITAMSSMLGSTVITNNTTGQTITSFTDNAIEANKWIVVNITAVQGGIDGDWELVSFVLFWRRVETLP